MLQVNQSLAPAGKGGGRHPLAPQMSQEVNQRPERGIKGQRLYNQISSSVVIWSGSKLMFLTLIKKMSDRNNITG